MRFLPALIIAAIGLASATADAQKAYDGSSVGGAPAAVLAPAADGTKVKVPVWMLYQCDAAGMNCAAVGPMNGLAVGRQESFKLVSANTPSAAATVFGGDYILSQTCSSYGTLNLQVLGPDGSTWQTIVSKTASDTSGGTGMSLGSYAQVRITVNGTAVCNGILARVPS